MTTINFEVPVRTVSEANVGCHWGTRGKRARRQREAAKTITQSRFSGMMSKMFPIQWAVCRYEITLTRIAPRKLDTDNLTRSLKAVRDGIADALRIDDGNERLSWHYRQEKRKLKEYSVIVEVTTL